MIPAWKLKRELKRIAVQIQAIPLLIYEPLVQFFYDRNLKKNLLLEKGAREQGKKIAIFLVYQPKGFAQSTYLTIDHLINSGFEIVLVSNCPLKTSDIEILKIKTILIVQRKNFGYDFGGYRDGIFLAREYCPNCEQILFLNDSVWFPIFNNNQLLHEMSESDSDYVGTQAFGNWVGEKFDGFFGSYCFLIKNPLLSSNAFNHYWDNYKLSSNKEVVLRRGERRFSREMLKVSHKPLAIFSHENFSKKLDQMSSDDIHQTLSELIAWDRDFSDEKDELLKSTIKDKKWVEHAKDLIIRLSRTKNFIGSSPVFSLAKLNFPMIKKNNEMLYIKAREAIIDAIDSGMISGVNPVIENELRDKVLFNTRGNRG